MTYRSTSTLRTLLYALVPALTLSACGADAPEFDQSPDAIAPAPVVETTLGEVPAGLRVDRLRNATVQLPMLPGIRVMLRDGSFRQDKPLILVTLDEGSWLTEDFDSDGQYEAGVLVRVTQGAATIPVQIPHLVLFGLGGRTLAQEAVLQLPPNTRISQIRRAGVFIEIDVVEEMPGDRRCCPTGRKTLRFRLNNGEFEPA